MHLATIERTLDVAKWLFQERELVQNERRESSEGCDND